MTHATAEHALSKIILTFNAGSSSLKFAAFGVDNGDLNASRRRPGRGDRRDAQGLGAIERPAKRPISSSTRRPASVDHQARDGRHSRTGCATSAMRSGIVAVGHRVVHGGPDMAAADADRRRRRCKDFASSSRSRRCTSRTTSPASRRRSRLSPERRRSPASTPPSIAAIRSSPTPSPCRASYYDEGIRRYGFHGLSYEYITRAADPRSRRRSRARTSSSPISATAPRCARSRTAARSPRPWASPRSTACRWARAAASSTRASCSI